MRDAFRQASAAASGNKNALYFLKKDAEFQKAKEEENA